MKYIYLTTPDNIKVEYRLAGAGSRIGAAVIDFLIQMAAFIIVLLIGFILVFDFGSLTFKVELTQSGYIIAFVLLWYFIVFFGYFILLEMLMKGQTIGKRIFRLRTIRQNGQPETFIQSIIRNIVRVFIDNIGIGVITMLFSKTCKRTGDMLAGTIVISENPNRISSSSLALKGLEIDEPASSLGSAYPITEEEYEILKDYFARKDDFIDKGYYARFQLISYFAEKFAVNPQSMDEKVLYQIMKEALYL